MLSTLLNFCHIWSKCLWYNIIITFVNLNSNQTLSIFASKPQNLFQKWTLFSDIVFRKGEDRHSEFGLQIDNGKY